MELLDLLIETEALHLDWCTDPGDLERALARRLTEVDPGDESPMPVHERLRHLKLARELGRVVQH